jgi:hypothetical protein
VSARDSPGPRGTPTIPLPNDEQRNWQRLTLLMLERRVLRVKRGDVPVMAEMLDEIDTVQREIETRLADGRTPLQVERDWDTISAWSVNACPGPPM